MRYQYEIDGPYEAIWKSTNGQRMSIGRGRSRAVFTELVDVMQALAMAGKDERGDDVFELTVRKVCVFEKGD